MKRYSLQQLIGYDAKTKLEHWREVRESDDYKTLLDFLGYNFRIVDNQTGKEVIRS